MLTQLLPGLRELRTPLAVGITWLVMAYLALGRNVPKTRPNEGVVASLWDLAILFEKTSVLGSLIFFAYFIGSFFTIRYDGVLLNLAKAMTYGPKLGVQRSLHHWENEIMTLESRARALGWKPNDLPKDLEAFFPDSEIATLLLQSSPAIHDKHDRLASEAELRVSMGVAMSAFSFVLAWRASPLFLLGLALAALTIRSGTTLAQEARGQLTVAVRIGAAKWPPYERLKLMASEPPATALIRSAPEFPNKKGLLRSTISTTCTYMHRLNNISARRAVKVSSK